MSTIGKILTVIMIAIGLWFVVSYVDVMWYQMIGGSPHSWNMFNITIELGQGR